MSNHIMTELKDRLRESFLETRSLRETAKRTGVARNTVRSILREEGLSTPTPTTISRLITEKHPESTAKPPSLIPYATHLKSVNFRFLETIFSGRHRSENLSFRNDIVTLANDLATDIGVHGVADELRLEMALGQFLMYRRFFLCALETSDKSYIGPYSKAHDKQAKSAESWISATNKALDQFNRFIRELEVRNGKRQPDLGRGNVFVNQQMSIQQAPEALSKTHPHE